MMLALGLNYGSTHDSSAAIAQDGRVLFAIAEERLSRRKHDGAFPKLAIQACLKAAGAQIGDVNHIVCGWPAHRQMLWNDMKSHVRGLHPAPALDVARRLLKGLVEDQFRSPEKLVRAQIGPFNAPFRNADHHYTHAVSTYAMSGFDRAVVLVVDGRGAWEASSVWLGEGTKLTHLRTTPWPNSLGLFYAAFTGFLGFEKYQDEWKVMGLAPYGIKGVDLSPFITWGNGSYNVRSDLLLGRRNGREYGHIEPFLGPARQPEDTLDQRHKDIAFAVQSACEEVECELIAQAVRQTGCRNVCIAGGVGLNSKANGLFLQRKLMDKIFVQPAAGDDGIAVGAALIPSFERGKRPGELIECYWGPSYADDDIRSTLDTYKLAYTATNNPAQAAARLLADGCLVGWFQGREEFGPRALGNRSILADPRYEENRDKVNMAVKFREGWRPFAPSVLEEACEELFESFHKSPFMILTFQAKEAARKKIAAAVHVDGSARVQSVTKAQNPRYYELISEFQKLTGVPSVLNTSFNLKGEAIVNTPFDAIRTFYTSGLDALVIGGFVLRKTPGKGPV